MNPYPYSISNLKFYKDLCFSTLNNLRNSENTVIDTAHIFKYISELEQSIDKLLVYTDDKNVELEYLRSQLQLQEESIDDLQFELQVKSGDL